MIHFSGSHNLDLVEILRHDLIQTLCFYLLLPFYFTLMPDVPLSKSCSSCTFACMLCTWSLGLSSCHSNGFHFHTSQNVASLFVKTEREK